MKALTLKSKSGTSLSVCLDENPNAFLEGEHILACLNNVEECTKENGGITITFRDVGSWTEEDHFQLGYKIKYGDLEVTSSLSVDGYNMSTYSHGETYVTPLGLTNQIYYLFDFDRFYVDGYDSGLPCLNNKSRSMLNLYFYHSSYNAYYNPYYSYITPPPEGLRVCLVTRESDGSYVSYVTDGFIPSSNDIYSASSFSYSLMSFLANEINTKFPNMSADVVYNSYSQTYYGYYRLDVWYEGGSNSSDQIIVLRPEYNQWYSEYMPSVMTDYAYPSWNSDQRQGWNSTYATPYSNFTCTEGYIYPKDNPDYTASIQVSSRSSKRYSDSKAYFEPLTITFDSLENLGIEKEYEHTIDMFNNMSINLSYYDYEIGEHIYEDLEPPFVISNCYREPESGGEWAE